MSQIRKLIIALSALSITRECDQIKALLEYDDNQSIFEELKSNEYKQFVIDICKIESPSENLEDLNKVFSKGDVKLKEIDEFYERNIIKETGYLDVLNFTDDLHFFYKKFVLGVITYRQTQAMMNFSEENY